MRITDDQRQPFGRRTILFNETGFETYSHFIDQYGCDGVSFSCDGYADAKTVKVFSPDLGRIAHPESIVAFDIGGAGAFARDFDFESFGRFKNVKLLTLSNLPLKGALERFFPKLEVLRLFDWKKNRIAFRDGLWPHLRCLQIVGLKGDLSQLAGWDLRSLFLDFSTLSPFSSLRSFPNLETFKAEGLNSEIDLSVLSDLAHLKHLSLRKPRRPPTTAGFASRSLEMMILEKIDAAGLANLDLPRNFPNLAIYGIDMGRKSVLEGWDGFAQYGDPFAAVHFRRYPFTE